MKLTPTEIDFFRNLHETGTGRQLIEYTERLIDHVCDARNWTEGDNKEIVTKVASVLQENLIDKIKLQNKPVKNNLNKFE